MDLETVRTAVRATLILLARLAKQTRTPADDMLASMLQANETRLVDAVAKLVDNPEPSPSEQQIVEALQSVGIRV